MPVEKLVFADENARATAIAELGDDPSKLEQLEAIRNAEIGVKVEGEDKPPEPKSEPVKPEKPVAEKQFTILDKDLPEGYDTPGKAFKSLKEAQELIKRQTEFIKTNLNQTNRGAAESEALTRAEKAEAELAKIRGEKPVTPETTADISAVKTDIQRIEALQAELEAEVEKDPDAAFTAEYHKKNRELSRLQTKNLNQYAELLKKATDEIQATKSIATDFVASSQKEKENVEAVRARESLYEEMTTLDIPELKLSKNAKDVENEYLAWRRDVAMARFGRPAANVNEEFEALEQLQLKNPELIQKLSLIGVPSEPTEDVKRYMLNCEYLDYKQGWRKDPVTGKFKRLTQYDPETNQFVPLILPSLKAAIQQKRLEEGFYEEKIDGAFQKGAKSVAEAASRRDKGAVELNGGADQGQTPGGTDWAVKVLQETNAEQAMIEYRKGNTAKVDELNKARLALGLEAIVFPE